VTSSPRLACRACRHETDYLGVQYCDRCFGPLDLVAPPERPDRAPTPLVAAPELGAAFGLEDLWLKDETVNPTGSFKDRVVAATAVRARATGVAVLACSSTGNLARAVAVGAANARLRSVVVVPEALSTSERDALVAQGATVVVVRGDYDAANRVATQGSEELSRWGWVNANLRPWYGAGSGTVADEIVEQAGPPDQVVLPMASGALAFQVARAFAAHGARPRLVVGQPAGCAPVAAAWAAGADDVEPVRPSTRVGVLAMGDPPDGSDVLTAARVSAGAVFAVEEADVDALAALVADRAGIAVDLASAVTVGAAREGVGSGVLDPAARTVVVLTGGPARWPERPVAAPGRAVTIDPSLAALRDAVEQEPSS
ncbi:MAG: pyridoxal-phosphate dependent enzyme, partial [Acidimicrobiales bacterium]